MTMRLRANQDRKTLAGASFTLHLDPDSERVSSPQISEF